MPVSRQEFTRIRAFIMSLPVTERKRLKNQERFMLDCPLRDKENNRCIVYEIRPWICHQYGRVIGLPCPYNSQVKFKSDEEADRDIEAYMKQIDSVFNGFAGFMAVDIGWPELERGM